MLSILKYLPIMLVLCQHNTLAYYAFYYAGIFGIFGYLKNGIYVIPIFMYPGAQMTKDPLQFDRVCIKQNTVTWSEKIIPKQI